MNTGSRRPRTSTLYEVTKSLKIAPDPSLMDTNENEKRTLETLYGNQVMQVKEQNQLRHSILGEIRWTMEDLSIDFGEDASVSTQCGRNVLAAQKEADRTFEKALQGGAVDEVGEAGIVRCGEDKHVAELTV